MKPLYRFIGVSFASILVLSGCVQNDSNNSTAQSQESDLSYSLPQQESDKGKVFGVCDEAGCRELEPGEETQENTKQKNLGTSVGEKVSFINEDAIISITNDDSGDAGQRDISEVIRDSQKNTILWFWSPYCPLCLREVDSIKEFAEQNKDDISIIGVGFSGRDGDQQVIKDFVEGNELIDNEIFSSPQFYDPTGEVWKSFGLLATPSFVFLDDEGVIAGKSSGVLGVDGLNSKSQELFKLQ